MNRRIKKTLLSQGIAPSQFGRAVQGLLVAWGVSGASPSQGDSAQSGLLSNESPSAANTDVVDTSEAFRFMLSRGLVLERISAESILELLMMVLNAEDKVGTGPSPLMFEWLETHVDLWKK